MSLNPQNFNYNYNNNNSGIFTKIYPNSKNYLLWTILVCCVYITIVQFSLCCGGINNSISARKYLSLNITAMKVNSIRLNEIENSMLNYTLNGKNDTKDAT
jgi:hypothetical protein